MKKKLQNDPENVKEETLNEGPKEEVVSEKEKLLELLQTLKDLAINSIGDLEVKISRL